MVYIKCKNYQQRKHKLSKLRLNNNGMLSGRKPAVKINCPKEADTRVELVGWTILGGCVKWLLQSFLASKAGETVEKGEKMVIHTGLLDLCMRGGIWPTMLKVNWSLLSPILLKRVVLETLAMNYEGRHDNIYFKYAYIVIYNPWL